MAYQYAGSTAPPSGTVEVWEEIALSGWPSLDMGETYLLIDSADVGKSAGYEVMSATPVTPGSAAPWSVTRGANGTVPYAHEPGWLCVLGGGSGGDLTKNLINVVTEFGVDNTGSVADNSTAINNAIEAAAAGGYDLYFPKQADGTAGIVLLQNPIVIGNGTNTTPSTYPGIRLVGTHPGASAVFNQNGAGVADMYGGTVLRWNGAANPTAFLEINGPIQGVGIERMTLDMGSPTIQPYRAILAQACQSGVFQDVAMVNVAVGLHILGRAYTGTGNGNSSWNRWKGIYIVTAGTNLAQQMNSTGAVQNINTYSNMGIIHDGQDLHNNNCYDTLEDIVLVSAGGANGPIGITFGGCDSIRYKNLSFIPAGGDAAGSGFGTTTYWSYKIMAYYGSGYPQCQDIVIENPDFGLGGTPVRNVNTVVTASPFRIRNINTNNSYPPNPQLPNVRWEAPYGTGPVGPPAVPASGTAVTNTYGCDATVYVNGGTISAITVVTEDGHSLNTGQTSGAVRVPFQGTITLTYTAAPTWTWWGD